MTTARLREYLSYCGKGMLGTICLDAVLVLVSGWLYAVGVVAVDRFIAVLWVVLGTVVMFPILVPLMVAGMWLSDRRNVRGQR